MGVTFKFKIDNPERLYKAIEQAPKQTLTNVRVAGKRSARDVQAGAQDKHRFTTRTGNLEQAIDTEFDDPNLTWKIGINQTKAKYGLAIHDGSKPHIIRFKKAKALRFPVGKAFAFAKQVNHPGTKPDRFIVNSGRRNEKHIQKLFSDAIENAFNKAYK